MLLSEIKYKKNGDIYKHQRLNLICDHCEKNYDNTYNNIIKGRKKYKNKDFCQSCKLGFRNKTMMNDEIKQKISNSLKGKSSGAEGLRWRWTYEQKENLKKIRPNKGTFEELYGKKKAKSIKKNMLESLSGQNNPMYGKPSPQGSGNGWSGWYNNWYFRSLRELSYMINVIEKENLVWESAEQKKYRIPYIDYKGSDRNYFADFVIDNTIIEIKPKKLVESKQVQLKKEYAEQWCKENGYAYIIVDDSQFETLSFEEIDKLIMEKKIEFTEKYTIQWKNYFNNRTDVCF